MLPSPSLARRRSPGYSSQNPGPSSGNSPLTLLPEMFSASWTQAPQSEAEAGSPLPISAWNELMAVPQRKPSGKGFDTVSPRLRFG